MSIIENLIKKKTDIKNRQPTALCCFYDGKFDSELSKVGINLIGVKDHSVYNWSTQCASQNIRLIKEQEIGNYSYDFVLCNDLVTQREQLLKYTKGLHLPGLVVSHEKFQETPYHLQQRLIEANVELISTEYESQGIQYGTEEIPNVKKDIPVLIEGNFQPHDHNVLFAIKKEIPNLVLIGYNPDIDFNIEPLFYEEYREYFARCKIFVNLPTQRNISHQLLWAMSNGAVPISLKISHIDNLFNKTSGISVNNVQELIVAIKHNLNNKTNIGERAKKVNSLLPICDFIKQWENTINRYSRKVFTV